jgi:hypothetical protein
MATKEKQVIIKQELVGAINPGKLNPQAFLRSDEVLLPRGDANENFLVMRETLAEVEVSN